jgi:uncharacterized protein involved in exopolysaccharide biosynthesis
MSNSPTGKDSQLDRATQTSGERVVYVLQEQARVGAGNQDISLRDLWGVVWRGKWAVFATTVIFAAGAVAYALLATEWYRAEVLLAPAEERGAPALAGQLGGLAALAGVSVGGGDSAEAVATLRSRELARAFIEDFELLPVFFADQWDASRDQWRGEDPANWPDIRDAVRYFHDNVLSTTENRQTGMVTLAIEWTDAEAAAAWADALVRRVNARLRDRALREAEANVTYLQEELARTNVITLQQTISRLLESELQKLMLARGNEEFAFRIVDSAEAPKYRVRPKRTLIVVVATVLGGILGVFGVFFAHAMRSNR